VKDIPEVSEYPLMNHYKENELSSDKWIEIISRLKKNNPNIFLVIYGGEPFLYNGLSDVINYCHSNSVYYTVISNNTDGIQKRIEKVRQEIGGVFKGFTSSVDPLIFSSSNQTSDEAEKSYKGFNRLLEMKKSGKAEDVVAEITVTKYSIQYLYQLIRTLSDNGIYSSVTVIDKQKTKYYDFSTVDDEDLLVQKNNGVRNEFDKIQKDDSLLIHIPKMLDQMYDDLPYNMKCTLKENVHNVTIDADGSFRLCLRIRGVDIPKVKLDNIIDVNGNIQKEVKESINKDYDNYCRNCLWTCMYFSDKFSDNILNH
jgi:MoaA/NifB/PqqE/SkfB family radical SAM enzyme